MEQQGTFYLFTGLSGAGKTTLGGMFYRHLHETKPNVVWLDGDEFRQTYQNAVGYGSDDRHASCFPAFRLCRLLTRQGIDVIYCTISMYDDVRRWARDNIPNYKEIYIRTKMETLYSRDPKGIYARGIDVVGVDLPCDYPKHPDIIVQNDGQSTPEVLVAQIEQALAANKGDGFLIG